jgi:Icc-related predicted phosphoesterase
MKILFTTDIHADPSLLGQLSRVAGSHRIDALIIGGDIVPHSLPQARVLGLLGAQAAYLENTLIPALQQMKARQDMDIYLDLSNDDFAANRHILEHYQGKLLHLLHMQKHPLNAHIDVLGYMNVPPTPFQRKDWEKPDTADRPYAPGARVRLRGYLTHTGRIQETVLDLDSHHTMEKDLNRLSAQIHRPFIFVAHCPPWDTPLDLLSNGQHAGSLSIRRFVEHWGRQGRMMASLHGHIHESPQVSGAVHTRINGTLCINPGQQNRLQFVIVEITGDAVTPEIVLIGSFHA